MEKQAAAEGRTARPAEAGSERPRAARTRKEDWIAVQLRRVYDEALGEAIPEDMLALLDRLDGKDPA